MINPYRSELEILFSRIIELKGSLFHIENIFQRDLQNKKSINNEFLKSEIAIISHLVISDISGPTDNGWEIIFPTNIKKTVSWKKYNKEIEKLISREACFLVAQGCEAFLRFLFNITAVFNYLNKEIAKKHDVDLDSCKSEKDFKNWIRKSKKMRATSNLFQLLEENCSKYSEINQANNLNITFSEFYQALAFFRHKVTHSSSLFTDMELESKKWLPRIKSILNSFFPYKKVSDENIFLLNKFSGQQNLKRIAEVGFQIYKALSISDNYEWKFEKQKLE